MSTGQYNFLPSLQAIDNSLTSLNNVDFYRANNGIPLYNQGGSEGYGLNAAVNGDSLSGFDVLGNGGQPQMPPANQGFDWGSMDNWAKIGGFVNNLAGAYTNWQGLGLAKDAFAHQKALDKVNVGNQVESVTGQINDLNAARNRRAANNGISQDQVHNVTTNFSTLG